MKLSLLPLLLILFGCGNNPNEVARRSGQYSDDYVLIEFASKLEEDELQRSNLLKN